MSLADYLENKLLDHIAGKTSFTMPAAYVSLHTGDPGETGANEVANSGAYARKSTVGADWNAAANGSISNVNDILFVTPTGPWGTATHFGTWDSGVYGGGNFLVGGDIDPDQAIESGNTVQFDGGTPGDLVINLD